MRKETKIILILLAMALVVGCSSGCDGGEGVTLDDETIDTFLYNQQGWIAQDVYKIEGDLVASLLFQKNLSTGISNVIFRDSNDGQIDTTRLSKGEEGYFLKCAFGECSLKVSANASMDKVDLTLTNEDDVKYYFAFGGDT